MLGAVRRADHARSARSARRARAARGVAAGGTALLAGIGAVYALHELYSATHTVPESATLSVATPGTTADASQERQERLAAEITKPSGVLDRDNLAKYQILHFLKLKGSSDARFALAVEALDRATDAYLEAKAVPGEELSVAALTAANTRDAATKAALDIWHQAGARETEDETELLVKMRDAHDAMRASIDTYLGLSASYASVVVGRTGFHVTGGQPPPPDAGAAPGVQLPPPPPPPPRTSAASAIPTKPGFLGDIEKGNGLKGLKKTTQGELARVESALARLGADDPADALRNDVAKLTLDVANAKAEDAKTKHTGDGTVTLAGTIANFLVARRAATAEDSDGDDWEFGKSRARRFV
jgi:hypothetical protein